VQQEEHRVLVEVRVAQLREDQELGVQQARVVRVLQEAPRMLAD
jgi:hypothetical protein